MLKCALLMTLLAVCETALDAAQNPPGEGRWTVYMVGGDSLWEGHWVQSLLSEVTQPDDFVDVTLAHLLRWPIEQGGDEGASGKPNPYAHDGAIFCINFSVMDNPAREALSVLVRSVASARVGLVAIDEYMSVNDYGEPPPTHLDRETTDDAASNPAGRCFPSLPRTSLCHPLSHQCS